MEFFLHSNSLEKMHQNPMLDFSYSNFRVGGFFERLLIHFFSAHFVSNFNFQEQEAWDRVLGQWTWIFFGFPSGVGQEDRQKKLKISWKGAVFSGLQKRIFREFSEEFSSAISQPTQLKNYSIVLNILNTE